MPELVIPNGRAPFIGAPHLHSSTMQLVEACHADESSMRDVSIPFSIPFFKPEVVGNKMSWVTASISRYPKSFIPAKDNLIPLSENDTHQLDVVFTYFLKPDAIVSFDLGIDSIDNNFYDQHCLGYHLQALLDDDREKVIIYTSSGLPCGTYNIVLAERYFTEDDPDHRTKLWVSKCKEIIVDVRKTFKQEKQKTKKARNSDDYDLEL